MIATVRLAALACCLLVTACGPTNPVGHYETDPASFVRSFEDSFPESGPGVEFARARFGQLKEQAHKWRVALDLRADQQFELTMMLPLLPHAVRLSGIWQRDGNTIELTTTRNGDREVTPPERHTVKLEGDTLHFQDKPGTPRFVLTRRDS